MKIKHFRGYGIIDAKEITQSKDSNGLVRTLVIKVQGNHECGLVIDDICSLYSWIVKKFCPCYSSWSDIKDYKYEEGYDAETEEDFCVYTFKF